MTARWPMNLGNVRNLGIKPRTFVLAAQGALANWTSLQYICFEIQNTFYSVMSKILLLYSDRALIELKRLFFYWQCNFCLYYNYYLTHEKIKNVDSTSEENNRWTFTVIKFLRSALTLRINIEVSSVRPQQPTSSLRLPRFTFTLRWFINL